jgi:hypothetical protein
LIHNIYHHKAIKNRFECFKSYFNKKRIEFQIISFTMRQFGALARSHPSQLPTCLKRHQHISRNRFANGGARLAPAIFHPLPAAGKGNVNTARLDLPVAAEAVTAASRSSTATPAAAKTPVVKPTTTYWPCKDGQLVRVVQTSGGGGTHTLEITVERLQENQEAQLLWYVNMLFYQCFASII